MDSYARQTLEKRIARTVEGLRKNRYEAEFIGKEKLLGRLDELMPEGCTCSVGGSVTLDETGVQEYLRGDRYTLYDRYAPGVDPAEVFHQAFDCDYYITSTNALTEDGLLYNIDGRGNRLAAMIYGPKHIIVIAGYNKIVTDLEAARDRMRTVAAPANALRLGKKTPCASTGVCQDCSSPDRICSQELITGWQMVPGRTRVIIVDGEYGY